MSADEGQAPLADIAHLTLLFGRLLMLNGANTSSVQTSMTRFAAALGCEAVFVVTYEALMVT